MPKPPDDDDVLDLIGAIGAGINAARDEALSPEDRQVAQGMADNLSANLRDQTN
ncbi:hypothetical protein [Streptomyces rimosus]|uniref:hypothetical protein n=1 Tax=Streptomyces rimosus TaxID=1927 RepID=UPI00378BF126